MKHLFNSIVRYVSMMLCSGAFGAAGPNFPPGVTLIDEIQAREQLPPGVEIFAVEVDWTNPFLRARVEVGIDEEGSLPKLWDRVAAESLKIQLSEPVESEDRWRPALDAEPAPPIRRPRFVDGIAAGAEMDMPAPVGNRPRDQVRIGGIAPWFFAGPTADADTNPPSPLAQGSAGVELRWLGHASQWQSRLPEFQFRDQFLMSSFDMVSGRATFMLVIDRTGRRLDLTAMTPWIEAAWGEHVWLAVHSVGPEARAGLGNWRLGRTATSREPSSSRPERAGVVLVLEKVKPGEMVDWARIDSLRYGASSFWGIHSPESTTSGKLWPVPLSPNVWVSANEARGVPWIELELPRARSVTEIRVIYAEAAGWSSDFNPDKIGVKLRETEPAAVRSLTIEKPGGAYSRILYSEAKSVDHIRVELPIPTRMRQPHPEARLMAIQLLGPWDGSE